MLIPCYVMSQCTFSMTVSINGNCAGIQGAVERQAIESWCNYINQQLKSIRLSKKECIAMNNQIQAEARGYSYDGCSAIFTISPCTCVGGDDEGTEIDLVLGPTYGQSFFSTNAANEPSDWWNDDMSRQNALNPEYQPYNPNIIETSDQNYNTQRTNLRNAAWTLDADKKFRSLNIDETTEINTESPDYSFIDAEWQFIKTSRNLPYNSVNEFYESMLQDIIKYREKILQVLSNRINEIESWYNQNSLRLAMELKEAEKRLDMAKYMVEYKGYLTITYINGMSDNPFADNATEKAFGKTRNELAYESVAALENELIEKYGMTAEDIAKMKAVIDKDNKVQQTAETLKEYEVDRINDNMANAIDIGVLLNDEIALLGLSKCEKALSEQVESINKNIEENKKLHDSEIDITNKFISIVDESAIPKSDSSLKEKLEWSKQITYLEEKILDIYGLYNESNENPNRKYEEIYIEYR